MPTYTVTGAPTIVDAGTSTLVAVTNNGGVPVLIEPLGRQVLPGASVTVPGWRDVRTVLRTSGPAASCDVTLTAGSPASKPGPGPVMLDPGGAVSMAVTITGGSWFTDEGLTVAASFPRTVTTPTPLYAAAPATVTVAGTVGTLTKTLGLNVVDGCAETFRFEASSDAERTAIADMAETVVVGTVQTLAARGVPLDLDLLTERIDETSVPILDPPEPSESPSASPSDS